MGYNTRFEGHWTITPPLRPEHAAHINKLQDDYDSDRRQRDGRPDYWCNWCVSEDGARIEYNGGEKFYDYVEWLRFIIDRYIKPWGTYKVNGTVYFAGEDVRDHGQITVTDNVIKVSR